LADLLALKGQIAQAAGHYRRAPLSSRRKAIAQRPFCTYKRPRKARTLPLPRRRGKRFSPLLRRARQRVDYHCSRAFNCICRAG
jgi:hypothetical protein